MLSNSLLPSCHHAHSAQPPAKLAAVMAAMLLLATSSIHAAPGDADSLNAQIVGSGVFASAVQADGKILIGGSFTSVLGQTRNNLARLNSDGSLDMDFDPDVGSEVYSIVELPFEAPAIGGKILIGGSFTTVGGITRNHIAQLNAGGSLDTSFNPNSLGYVTKLALQSDGKILLCGPLGQVGGMSRNYLARINADGTPDTGFTTDPNDFIYSLVVQKKEGEYDKILIGGDFTSVAGSTRNRIARLNFDGSPDSFNPDVDNTVESLVVQTDDKILLGGSFANVGGSTRNHIARVNADGTLDTVFNPNADLRVQSLAVQSDGKVLIGGSFTTVGGTTRNHIARLTASGAVESSYNPNLDDNVDCITLDASGNALIGGTFTTVGGATRNRFARLLGDGTGATLSVTTAAASSITANSAVLGGVVISEGSSPVTDRGIVWATTSVPTTVNNKVAIGIGIGAFSATVTGLPSNTVIYVRAYATNTGSTAYGNEISFSTGGSGFAVRAWTGDADAGVTAQTLWAYKLTGTADVTINNVVFTVIPGTATPSVANKFAVTGTTNGLFQTGNLLKGNSNALANETIYGGNPATITLQDLTVGSKYQLSVYGAGYSVATPREATWASGSDSAVFDEQQFGTDQGIRVTYGFTADATTRTITCTPLVPADTWTLCGLALEPVIDPPTVTELSKDETFIEDTELNLTDIVISNMDSATVTARLTLSDLAAGSLNTGTSGSVTSTFASGVWTATGAIADVNRLLAGLIFTPAANYNGIFTIDTSVNDGVAAPFTGTKTMTGTAVNDAPSFALSRMRAAIVSGTGPQSYPAFVNDITPGPEDESQQSVTFSVTNNNNALFTSQPAVSPDGTLTFTSGSTFGTATLTVQASDDGGTDNGGVSTSVAKTYTITTIPGAQARLGDTVNLDLSWVPLGLGESLKVIGLPAGLVFSAGPPPRISGRVLGAADKSGTFIQIMTGRKVVSKLPLELVAESYIAASTYELLLEEAGQPTGKLRVTVSNPTAKVTNPAFSATLDRAGAVQRKVSGTFTAGALPQTVRVTFPAVTTTPAISFDLVITSGSDLVTAATFPTSGLTGRGFRLARPSRIPVGNPALTLTLPPALNGDRTNTPGGIGFGRGTVSSTALLTLSGQLGDAQAFTSGLSLSQTNQAVVWMTPYTNKASYIGGIIDIADTGAAQRAASTNAAVTGLQWSKLADTKSTSYPAGFGPLALNAASSRWVPATTVNGIAESLALDFRAIETKYIAPAAGILPSRLSLQNSFTLIRLAPDNAVPFMGKVTPTTGEFSGRLTPAAPATKSDFSGVLLQDDSFGALVGQGLIKIPVTSTVAGSYQTVGIRFFQPSSLGLHRLRIGETANISLSSITLASGETLKVIGLPTGLTLNGNAITGTVTGLGLATGVQIQVLKGKTIVRTVTLDLAVEPYAIAGRYEVLLENAGLPVGKLQVTITSPTAKEARAAFTAVLDRLGEPQRRTTGFFTASAASPLAVTVAFPVFKTFPAVTYVMSISATSNTVTASTTPASAITARGFRLARAGHLPVGVPALTIAFPPAVPGNRTTTPGGIGYAKGTITTAGLVPLSGMLGDGQTFTASLNLAQTNQAVVWVTPYKSKSSYLGGLVSLAAPATPDRGLAIASVPSSLKWARVPDAKAPSYPLGFSALDLGALSSRWVPAANATALAESLGLYFRGINLSYISPTPDILPRYLSLRDSSALLSISPTNAVPFTAGKAVGKDGSFSGTLVLPPAQKSFMSGVFLQDPATGYTIGQGLIKLPINAPLKGSFQTFGAELGN